MTMREEAYRLIDTLPENSVRFIIQIIKNMSPDFYKGKVIEEPVEYLKGRKKLDQIASLQDDWNGNGAQAFSKKHISRMKEILSVLEYEPEIYPTANDMIQLEYDKQNGEHIEIEVPESGSAEYYYIDQKQTDHFGCVEVNEESMNDLIRRFYESAI